MGRHLDKPQAGSSSGRCRAHCPGPRGLSRLRRRTQGPGQQAGGPRCPSQPREGDLEHKAQLPTTGTSPAAVRESSARPRGPGSFTWLAPCPTDPGVAGQQRKCDPGGWVRRGDPGPTPGPLVSSDLQRQRRQPGTETPPGATSLLRGRRSWEAAGAHRGQGLGAAGQGKKRKEERPSMGCMGRRVPQPHGHPSEQKPTPPCGRHPGAPSRWMPQGLRPHLWR